MRPKTTIAILLLFFIAAASLGAQTTEPSPSPSPSPTPTPTPTPSPTPIAEPYTQEEFPGWLLALRRAEIIFFGSLPFSFLLAYEGVEIGRYFAYGEDPAYRPWPFRTGSGVAFSLEEQMLVVGSTILISSLVALVDFLISEATRPQAPPREATRPAPPPAP